MPQTGIRPDGADSIWVLEDPSRPNDAALAVAERLGMEFRRVPLTWSAAGLLANFARNGSLRGLRSVLPIAADPPALTLSSGRRPAAVAAWLKQACGSRMVHFGTTTAQTRLIDLHIADNDAGDEDAPGQLAILGAPQRFSPLAIHAARSQWMERLEYLPRPRLAVLLGHGPFGGALPPSELARLGRGLGAAMRAAKGAMLITADRSCGRQATDALSTSLGDCLHLLHRANEPGPDPEPGVLALADAVLAIGHVGDRLLRACALPAPIYVAAVTPLSPAEQRLQTRLLQAGQIRRLDGAITPWPRRPLDEAGRIADRVRALLPCAPSLAPSPPNV